MLNFTKTITKGGFATLKQLISITKVYNSTLSEFQYSYNSTMGVIRGGLHDEFEIQGIKVQIASVAGMGTCIGFPYWRIGVCFFFISFFNLYFS